MNQDFWLPPGKIRHFVYISFNIYHKKAIASFLWPQRFLNLYFMMTKMDKEGYSELDIDGASKGDRGITLLKEFSLHTEFALRQRMLSP